MTSMLALQCRRWTFGLWMEKSRCLRTYYVRMYGSRTALSAVCLCFCPSSSIPLNSLPMPHASLCSSLLLSWQIPPSSLYIINTVGFIRHPFCHEAVWGSTVFRFISLSLIHQQDWYTTLHPARHASRVWKVEKTLSVELYAVDIRRILKHVIQQIASSF